jgi:hypothetical protein
LELVDLHIPWLAALDGTDRRIRIACAITGAPNNLLAAIDGTATTKPIQGPIAFDVFEGLVEAAITVVVFVIADLRLGQRPLT